MTREGRGEEGGLGGGGEVEEGRCDARFMAELL